ncbi:A24 family peptidase [Nocardioides panacisoli]|uniref:prepilin peptidase n=1 Tax=Nocardioides panacisoli TaxID=627624 RepID=UPI001C633642|nr:A24 family peptidase [Nocardioides panacisoli]QYJ05203.1 A24 family peptidase [Nocardioides panacisoli]
MTWPVALAGAVACGAGGALVPALVRRLPEPPHEPPVEGEPPKPAYADLGARPQLLPLAVVSSAAVGTSLGALLGWDWWLLLLWPLVPVGVLLAWVDWHTRLLPRVVVLPATAYALAFGLVRWPLTGDHAELLRGIVALLAVRTLFWLLWRVRQAGMGFGDVRLSALLGLVLGYAGWAEVVVGLYAAFLGFALPFLLLAVVRRDRGLMRRSHPFGPFLVAGAWVGLLVGSPVATALGY